MTGDLILSCTLFRGLDPTQLQYAYDFFHAQEKTFRKNEYLHKAGSVLSQFGLLISGHIQVFMDDFDGNQMIMANVVPGRPSANPCAICSQRRRYISGA